MFGFCLAAVLAGSDSVSSELRVVMESDIDQATREEGWEKVGLAEENAQIELTFLLKQTNLQELARTAMAVSDPRSDSYGNHLSLEEVNTLTAPTQNAVVSIDRFLQQHGVTAVHRNGNSDTIRVSVPIKVAESMLETTYYRFTHKASGTTALRAHNYTLPSSVAANLDLVAPTVKFPGIRKGPRQVAKNLQQSAPLRTNTPSSLRELYNVGSVMGNASSNIQSCTAFLNQFFEQKDLTEFWQKYYPELAALKEEIKTIGPDGSNSGIEAALDIEYITAMGAGVATQFWSFKGSAPGNPENEPFLDWITLVGNTSDSDVPKIFSTSYGECEGTVGTAYLMRIEAEFQKTAARGISLLFASGDSGVGSDSGICKGGRFCGQWPAGSPWVTGVGGSEGGSSTVPEVAWGGSSGGFSDRFPRSLATYQEEAVSNYLKTATDLPAASHYNGTSRAFPDVSAQATNFLVVSNGNTDGVAGTSCASPTFGGIIGLLNDLRLQAGKPTLGFLNPFFYQNPGVFNDIVKGNNPGCGTRGFSAIKGWDPVTGLGTPDYSKLAAAVMK